MATFDILFGPSAATFSSDWIISAFGSKTLIFSGFPASGTATANFATGKIYLDGDFGTSYTLNTLPISPLISDVTLHTGLCKNDFTSPTQMLEGNGFGLRFKYKNNEAAPSPLNIPLEFPVSLARIISLNRLFVRAQTFASGQTIYAMRWAAPEDGSAMSGELICGAGSNTDFLKITGNYTVWSNMLSVSPANVNIGGQVIITDGNALFDSMSSFAFAYSSAGGITRNAVAEVITRSSSSVTLVIPPMPGIISAVVTIIGLFVYIPISFSPFYWSPLEFEPISLNPENPGPFEPEPPEEGDPVPENFEAPIVPYTVNIPDTSGVYVIDPNATSDTYYDHDEGGTVSFPIPTPFVKTGYLGG